MNKKTKKVISIVSVISLISVLTIGLLYVARRNNYIYLTQFGAASSRQMMGYGIKTRNGEIVLIDGGTKDDAKQLEEYIMENGGSVKAWFITHIHSDHTGAFQIISQNPNIKIEQIYMSINSKQWYLENDQSRTEDTESFFEVIENNQEIQNKIIEPQINDKVKIDNVIVNVLGIKNPEILTNATNNSSMIIKIKVNNKKILFLGDTGTESSEKIIKNQGDNLKADIVQMSHHGQNGATEELYQIVKPEICLWPTPEWLWNNDINGTEDSGPWKTKETRKWMENLNVKQHYIEKDGTVKIMIF